jgi:hypothetical protein
VDVYGGGLDNLLLEGKWKNYFIWKLFWYRQ